MAPSPSRALKWNIGALTKKLFVLAAPAEGAGHDMHFDSTVFELLEELFCKSEWFTRRFTRDFGEHRPTNCIVYWTAVIRIDQAQVPQFTSLIEIGHSWRSYLD